ncbi:MAG: hypothetical protein A2249_01450 [Candidatus Jacksonbacteria bacterium RIFOXYA2_FULL_44_7]|uniref:POTRA domain-containing protein n=1 Tax=Candidatus Jacksonbacteria bacterium RIFCSPLOWO2_02_FULL_44_20 TaxID=1798460 RepID=A0A1G2A6A3_9BACT|nr:MAG: hypothetical protein UW39_C0003G0013 [Parcubacteria group bacterium GW2011_GWC2_44_17]OGY72129.1 MAG: hypothetical protein A3E05_01450 [Candidatus Jacksonbacteria bacterium RIFCSPHIGHO2_12_FULL_44_12]OGY72209.1 MAG: hypothetical protein A3H61_05490 [Candidatus Jacksonbacteria bacterium RIFCSPLOWO2_02_FULL_44_20]OGY73220.1 MAG: hypothetical protein A3H07_03420 [Candidatus Jacksonbacteria bacterium RIFCSPLOWO2_12_FULL_44_15b]OGY77017.1 MAG: hypothetical protein A2249_01450 [Candidatus Jac
MPRRDYSKKSHVYKAPRMHVRRDKVKREIVKKRVRAFFFSIILAGFIAVFGYWIFFSPIFMITDFVAQEETQENGRENSLKDEVKASATEYLNKRIFLILPRQNYFLFSAENLKTRLIQTHFNFPVEEFTVQKKFPRSASVIFKRRVSRFVVVTRHEIQDEESMKIIEKAYLADSSGVVVSADVSPAPPNLPRIILLTTAEFAKYDLILDAPSVLAVLYLIDNLEKNRDASTNPAPEVKEIEIQKDRPDEFIVKTEDGYSIYFTLQYDLTKQITYLMNLLLKIGDMGKDVTYIDLRVDNRAYVCCNLSIQ